MLKVAWNKEHTWKIVKKYVNGKLVAIKYKDNWFVPVKDFSGICYDDSGNSYIGGDCCCNCALNNLCKSSNPINDACSEFDMLNMRMEICNKM